MCVCTLTACGFHLRGMGDFNLAGVNVSVQTKTPYNHFEKVLKQQLKSSGANLMVANNQPLNTKNAAEVVIEITSLEFTLHGNLRDVTGRANEYEMIAKLDYTIHSVDLADASNSINSTQQAGTGTGIDTALDIGKSLSASEHYYQDFLDPIGLKIQQENAKQLLQQKLAQQLIRQLQLQLKH